MLRHLALTLLAIAALGGAARAQAPASSGDGLSLSAGASAWSGDFGAPWRTEIRAGLVTGRYKTGDLRLTASLPWMQIRSQGAVFTGIDGAPLLVAPGVAMTRSRREGVGDLTLGASQFLPSVAGSRLDLDLFAKVKLPTGSTSRGVSTGKTDTSIGAEASLPLGRFVPSASVSYRQFGNTGDWRLKDGFAGSVAGTYLVSDDVAAMLSYDYAQGASAFIEDSHEVVLGVSKRLASGARLTGFVGAGLSRGAADTTGGVSLTLAQW